MMKPTKRTHNNLYNRKLILCAKAFKKLFWIILVLLAIGVFAYLVYSIYKSSLGDEVKYNLIIQSLGMSLTFLLLLLTYRAFKTSQIERNYSVKPYIIAKEIDIGYVGGDRKKPMLDFYLHNEGLGIALDLNVLMIQDKQNIEVLSEYYPRLGLQDEPIYVEFEFKDEIKPSYLYHLIIDFRDIYRKKYRNVFNVIFDEELEVADLKEKHFEL